MLGFTTPSIERQIFERFLQEVKALMQRKGIKSPSGFISYAWETPPNGESNKRLQAWLSQLKKDFATLNIDLFLDIHNINGDMRAAMREIKARNFVFLIGTPRCKERAEQDTLYRLPTFNAQLLPMIGNAIVMVENSDVLYVVEKNNQELLLIGEITLPHIDQTKIEWKQEVGYQRAQSSEYAHQLIEQALKQVSSKSVTNVAYEFGLTLDKVKSFSQALMPLLYQGDFGISFPKDISSDILIRDFREPNEYYRNFITTNPLGLLPGICPALQTDKDYEKLVGEFLAWKFEIWKEQLSCRFQEELKLYIPARGDYSAECHHSKPMEEHVVEFMQNHGAKVMLLLGSSGSGKTCFGQYISTLMAQQNYTPIWISLPALQNPQEHAVEEGLKLLDVPESHIEAFKQKPLLIILDGYDEVKDLANLYESNHLENWNAKVIITCRNEFLMAKNYNLWFKPKNSHYIERHLAVFNATEISAYLQKYIALQNPSWSLARYEAEIAQIEGLRQMIETPFLLHIVADVLPDIAAKHHGKQEKLKVTKRALYERFVDQWFEKHLVRWEGQGKLALLDEGLHLDKDNQQEWIDERVAVLRSYAENFAYRLFSAGIDTISPKAEYPWIKELFDNKPRAKLIRSSCPLKKTGEESYGFIHKSLLEYLVTPQIVQEAEMISKGKQMATASSSSGSFSRELKHLNQQLLLPAMVQFLSDTLKEKPGLEAGLWAIVYSSRQNEANAIAAANAMTIFNAVRTSFSGKDLSRIRIPGANLSSAICDNTDFESADLTNVNLTGAWLQGTSLSHSTMSGVELGEYPSLNEGSHCCYSPDGQLLVVVGNEIKLFDTISHRLVKNFRGVPSSFVTSISFNPDGQLLAIAGIGHNAAFLWNVTKGTLQQTLEVVTKSDKPWINYYINCVAFSPNGQLLATASTDKTVRVWYVAIGVLQRTLNHPEEVTSVAFSPDGQLLATGSTDKTARLWRVATGAPEKILMHANWVTCLAFSPDGKLLATGSIDYCVILWHVAAGTPHKTLVHKGSINCLAFSLDGQLLATGSEDRTVNVWHVATGLLQRTLEGHAAKVESVAFNTDGGLATGSGYIIKLWKESSRAVQKAVDEHTQCVNSVAFSLDGQMLATGSSDKTTIWSAERGALLKTLEGRATSLAFSVDGQFIATGSGYTTDKTAKIWHVATGALQRTLNHRNWVHSVAFSPDGQLLATGSTDAKLWYVIPKLWYVVTGGLDKAFDGHNNGVSSVAFSPNGQLLATGSADKTVKIWHVATSVLQRTLSHPEEVRSIAFSPDGQLLATGCNDKTVRLWRVTTGVLQESCMGHKSWVMKITFSFGGYFATIGYDDDTLYLWQHFSGEKKPQSFITKVSATPKDIAFGQNSQGIFLASGHEDCSVRYWQLIQKSNKPYLQLIWTTHQNALLSQDACIEGVIGLSKNNFDLLLQRGAIGKPLMMSNAGKNASDATINRNNGESSRMGATNDDDNRNDNNAKNNCCIS